MATDILTPALIRSTSRNLSVTELIQTAETLKQNNQVRSVETLYSTWIQHNQDNPLLYAVLFNYSVILSDSGQLNIARECLQRAITLNPDFMPAYINLGRVHERLGNGALAVAQWTAALARMPTIDGTSINYKTTALNQSARALEGANQDDAAENMLRQSLDIDCHQSEVIQHYVALRQRQCEWPVLLPSQRVTHGHLMDGMSPLSAAALSDDPLFQLALACHYNKMDVGTPAEAMLSWPRCPTTTAPLRVGYLSSDLREHAVGFLMTEVFGLHDRSKVEVFAYYCGPEAQDTLHASFKASVDHWTCISNLDDAAAAQRIAEDGIQILVDLNGYTREARLKLIALRPAPIIVNWLGYPGTMGSPYHHYIIADDWIIPETHEIYYSERVVRLPCYQPSARKRNVANQRPSRSEVGLPEDAMVYCCFNGTHKISRFTFERWMMVLARVSGSVLWLLGSTNGANERLRDYAAGLGIARERVIFADKLTNPFHLARYTLADLFLDTTPYGAHTTASDALWMGVPVLTLSGRSFASRVCGSLARAAGIPELVCTSAEAFVDRAVQFGNDRILLQPYRDRLRMGRESCILFDTRSLVHHLEVLYGRMWSDLQNGSLPKPELANLEAYLEVGRQVNHDEIEVQLIQDYHGWWLNTLTQRHRLRPLVPDRRTAALGPSEIA
jgi:predicted O-linked N-acetylglucosamine transferase (SPINDLY family)